MDPNISQYAEDDWRPVAELFNTVFGNRCRLIWKATSAGLVRDVLADWMHRHPTSAAWVARRSSGPVGFVSAHVTNEAEGVITTPVCDPDDLGTLALLTTTAEGFLRGPGGRAVRINGLTREYGVGVGEPRHIWLLNHGYCTDDVNQFEYVMELDIAQLPLSPQVEEFRRRNEAEGFVFEFLRGEHAASLREFAPDWSLGGLGQPDEGNPARYPFAICRQHDTVVGYCGTCHGPSKYGQGGWSFILLRGIGDRGCPYAGRGIGAVLLEMANQWLQDRGVTFQVLVTGVGNPTQRLYRKAGYTYCFVQAKEIRKVLE